MGRFSDGLVVKIDESGRLEWQRTLGASGAMDEARCVVEASDGFIIGGSINKGGRSRPGLWKLGRSGQAKWSRAFEGEGHGAVRGLVLGKAGIVATGYLGFAEAEVPFIADERPDISNRSTCSSYWDVGGNGTGRHARSSMMGSSVMLVEIAI